MSRFLSARNCGLKPYIPGEQPTNPERLIKLNTNESPYPVSEAARRAADAKLRDARLYPDPEYLELRLALASILDVDADCIMATNGSDEALNFAFSAFCDDDTPAVFADITYGFYPVFAASNHVPAKVIPLRDDLAIDTDAFCAFGARGERGMLVIPNPNAPTGLLLGLGDIERILAANAHNIVVIDEAYIDFGGQSAVGLIEEYDNLVVTRTFSKSHSMAGSRLGFCIACTDLIADLNMMRNSLNPYSVSNEAVALALGVLSDNAAVQANCALVSQTREETSAALRQMGFELTDSRANFIFARHPRLGGQEIYEQLKSRDIIVRHFDGARIADYNRISIGTPAQMEALVAALKEILEEMA